MTVSITHATVATGTDAGTGEIHKAEWNADHVISGLDPIATVLGTPDTAYEFDTTSLTGLTAIGTATAEDANTTIPGHYWVKKNQSGVTTTITGRYAAVTAPFTAITKLTDAPLTGLNYMRVGGLWVAAASPGAIDAVHGVYENGWTHEVIRYSSSTAYGSTPGSIAAGTWSLPIYYAIVAHSDTNVDYLISRNGYVWLAVLTGRNPSLTLGSVGIMVDPENGSVNGAAAYDYLRIWNSAKTLTTA